MGKISHLQIREKELQPVTSHTPRYVNARDTAICQLLAEDIKTKAFKYITNKALINLYKERVGKTSNFAQYRVLRRDMPSTTIVAHLWHYGLRHIHPDPHQARPITVREAARLQSFDDDFIFLGGMAASYKMIGNAVPPLFAEHIAKALKIILT